MTGKCAGAAAPPRPPFLWKGGKEPAYPAIPILWQGACGSEMCEARREPVLSRTGALPVGPSLSTRRTRAST
jgi:hypothetical protein